jgi:Zn-dependent protease
MGLINLLKQDPTLFALLTVLLLYSVILHEVAHGWVAERFGDDTARRYGRITLNPAPHIDPMGLLMLLVAGFGWAKPVPVDYERLRGRRVAFAMVSLAGPLTNILIAAAAMLVLEAGLAPRGTLAGTACAILARINILLAAFNLIPIPPLDGSKIVSEMLPEGPRRAYLRLDRIGFFVVIALVFTGALNPVTGFMEGVVRGLISVVLRLG